jgi:hypothetical protein
VARARLPHSIAIAARARLLHPIGSLVFHVGAPPSARWRPIKSSAHRHRHRREVAAPTSHPHRREGAAPTSHPHRREDPAPKPHWLTGLSCGSAALGAMAFDQKQRSPPPPSPRGRGSHIPSPSPRGPGSYTPLAHWSFMWERRPRRDGVRSKAALTATAIAARARLPHPIPIAARARLTFLAFCLGWVRLQQSAKKPPVGWLL